MTKPPIPWPIEPIFPLVSAPPPATHGLVRRLLAVSLVAGAAAAAILVLTELPAWANDNLFVDDQVGILTATDIAQLQRDANLWPFAVRLIVSNRSRTSSGFNTSIRHQVITPNTVAIGIDPSAHRSAVFAGRETQVQPEAWPGLLTAGNPSFRQGHWAEGVRTLVSECRQARAAHLHAPGEREPTPTPEREPAAPPPVYAQAPQAAAPPPPPPPVHAVAHTAVATPAPAPAEHHGWGFWGWALFLLVAFAVGRVGWTLWRMRMDAPGRGRGIGIGPAGPTPIERDEPASRIPLSKLTPPGLPGMGADLRMPAMPKPTSAPPSGPTASVGGPMGGFPGSRPGLGAAGAAGVAVGAAALGASAVATYEVARRRKEEERLRLQNNEDTRNRAMLADAFDLPPTEIAPPTPPPAPARPTATGGGSDWSARPANYRSIAPAPAPAPRPRTPTPPPAPSRSSSDDSSGGGSSYGSSGGGTDFGGFGGSGGGFDGGTDSGATGGGSSW